MLLAVIAIVFPATIIGSEPLSHSGDEDEGWNIAYIVDDGAVIASGTPEQVISNQDVIRKYLGSDFKLK